MPYVLKKVSAPFDVVDGHLAGRQFRHGVEYAEIPQRYADRFDSAGAPLAAPEKEQPEKTKKRRETVMPDAADTKEE